MMVMVMMVVMVAMMVMMVVMVMMLLMVATAMVMVMVMGALTVVMAMVLMPALAEVTRVPMTQHASDGAYKLQLIWRAPEVPRARPCWRKQHLRQCGGSEDGICII